MCAGVAFLHSRGTVHGYLCPDYVYLTNDLDVKLGAVGAATLVDLPVQAATEIRAALAPFSAPEVAAGAYPTFASDVFSLGVLVFFALSGGDLLLGRHAANRDQLSAVLTAVVAPIESVFQGVADILPLMCSPQAEARPLAAAVIEHPFVWDFDAVEAFLLHVWKTLPGMDDVAAELAGAWSTTVDATSAAPHDTHLRAGLHVWVDLVAAVELARGGQPVTGDGVAAKALSMAHDPAFAPPVPPSESDMRYLAVICNAALQSYSARLASRLAAVRGFYAV